MQDFESCMRSITRSGRRPGTEALGTCVIYSESEEAPASYASMLGTPMIITMVFLQCAVWKINLHHGIKLPIPGLYLYDEASNPVSQCNSMSNQSTLSHQLFPAPLNYDDLFRSQPPKQWPIHSQSNNRHWNNSKPAKQQPIHCQPPNQRPNRC